MKNWQQSGNSYILRDVTSQQKELNAGIYLGTMDGDSIYVGDFKGVINNVYTFERDEKETKLTFKTAIKPIFAY